jgi:shikimate dehydrogenase
MNMLGVNVTIPHKEAVIRFLDDVDAHALDIGAVNTIVNRDGRLFGCNTDGPGYLLSLRKEVGFSPAGKRVVIIGAGGAARSILYSLLGLNPASVVLANRTIKRADSLANEFAKILRAC